MIYPIYNYFALSATQEKVLPPINFPLGHTSKARCYRRYVQLVL